MSRKCINVDGTLFIAPKDIGKNQMYEICTEIKDLEYDKVSRILTLEYGFEMVNFLLVA